MESMMYSKGPGQSNENIQRLHILEKTKILLAKKMGN